MADLKNIRKSISQIAKLLYEKDLTDSCGGNISVRDGDKIYITPRRSGESHQWVVEEDAIIVTDLCKVPLIGDVADISREAIIHYHIYQNFKDINAVFHSHPFYIMVYGAAHMDIPMVSEATRHFLGETPISCTEELVPGSKEMADGVIENFNQRRKSDPPTPALLCNLPFHGVFAASKELNHAFITLESAERNARMLIHRQLMFGNDPKADLSIHRRLSAKERHSIEEVGEVCQPGFTYNSAFGETTTFNGKQIEKPGNDQDLTEKITKEVLRELKKQRGR
jgi:L-fuculose-phosphate aldolase